MKQLSDFLVEKRIWLLCIFLLMAVGSIFLMPKVVTNTDMAKYMPDDSEMKQGKDLMEQQMPETAKVQSQVRVMFDNLTDEQKGELKERLAAIPGVTSVTYQPDSPDYNRDGHTLYVLKSDAEYDSDTFTEIEETLDRDYSSGYTMKYKSDDPNSNALTTGIMLGAVGILLLVLLVMSNSWLEPVIFLLSVGFAVVINMGTNAFLPSVSKMTNSIAAIMQLVLSMDYAIMLSNRYRQAAKKTEDRVEAMKQAVRSAIPSMCSSAVTTIVGLLALCFMSFKIGGDMGVVFAKGVFFSLLGCFAVLPAMLLIFDRPIRATAKRSLNVPTGFLAVFSTKCRYFIAAGFVILFVVVFILKGGSVISFVMPQNDEVTKVFPKDNNFVVLYSNSDEAAIPEMAEELSGKSGIRAVNSYGTTLGKKMNAEEMMGFVSSMFGLEQNQMLDISIFKLFYYDHYADRSGEKVTPKELLSFFQKAAVENPLLAGLMDDEMKARLDEAAASPFLPAIRLSVPEMYEAVKSLAPELNESVLSLAYAFYFSQMEYDDSWTLSIDDLVTDISKSETINAVLDTKTQMILSTAISGIENGKKQLVGPDYSLLAVTTELIDGSDEAMAFTGELNRLCGEKLKGKYYLIGSTPMAYEMSKSFDGELNRVTIITAVAIFLVVLITFRNFMIPLVLVALIQCSVYMTMVAMRFANVSLYYVALLIVQSILMGATIDYAIVFTNFYRDKRKEKELDGAMKSAYKASIRTILTSGLVMILCCALLGSAFEEPAIGQICNILAIGTTSAVVMILFVLPGLLAACDRLVIRRKREE